MGVLPPFLQDGKLHNICLVLEGYEEYYYLMVLYITCGIFLHLLSELRLLGIW